MIELMNKNKEIISKQALLFVLAAVLVLAFINFVTAFTEPTEIPPGGNVPAPLNVGSQAQTKLGDLTVNNFSVVNNFISGSISSISGVFSGVLSVDDQICLRGDCITAWKDDGGGGGCVDITCSWNDFSSCFNIPGSCIYTSCEPPCGPCGTTIPEPSSCGGA